MPCTYTQHCTFQISTLFVFRTTTQDDVENYFRLQRGRCPEELTIEKYMLKKAAISTAILIKTENKELSDQTEMPKILTIMNNIKIKESIRQLQCTFNIMLDKEIMQTAGPNLLL